MNAGIHPPRRQRAALGDLVGRPAGIGHDVTATATRKKLIEVALPLDAINRASAREKSIRHGHPSTLHLWWARRPLAAARAIICGAGWRLPTWRAKRRSMKPSRLRSSLPTVTSMSVFESNGMPEWHDLLPFLAHRTADSNIRSRRCCTLLTKGTEATKQADRNADESEL